MSNTFKDKNYNKFKHSFSYYNNEEQKEKEIVPNLKTRNKLFKKFDRDNYDMGEQYHFKYLKSKKILNRDMLNQLNDLG